MNYSKFGQKFTRDNGITQLMDDLGNANSNNNSEVIMLGGGNPALIPDANDVFVKELEKLIHSKQVDQMLGLYDGPQGADDFLQSLADMLNQHYGWNLNKENIALSNGSQSSFFSLFNLLSGEMPDGGFKKILFPLAPEYVGYADQGLSENQFISLKPEIKLFNEKQQFKYEINLEAVEKILSENYQNIGALCVSRPTNPTGNVITDDELERLDQLAQQYTIPLIVDNAYGHPFPGAIYIDAKLRWNENMILCMSLSKLGLPGLRTGIVIANTELIKAMSRINGTLILAPNSVGATLMTRLIKDRELLPLCNNIIKPYYQNKAQTAVELFNEVFTGLPVYLHKLEGAFFMWLWMKNTDMNCENLYKALKKENVYVIPGHNFFIGIDDEWKHKHQCIRINYAKDESVLRKGLLAIRKQLFNA